MPTTRPPELLAQRVASLILLVVASLLVAPGALAEEEEFPGPIETDRPDQTESSNVVPRNYFQLEAGVAYASLNTETNRQTSVDLLGVLGRIGLTRKLELRYTWAGWSVSDESSGGSDRGLSDFGIGVKLKLREERGAAPQTSVIIDTVIPGGDREFTSGRFDPGVRFTMSNTIGERIGLGYNLGVVWATGSDDTGDRDTLSRFVYTVAAGFSLAPTVGAFVELFGSAALSDAFRGPIHNFDGGFTWQPLPNVQLDISSGFNLNEGTDEWFIGAGVSFRVPR